MDAYRGKSSPWRWAADAHTLGLLAFGIDSLIELISAWVLLWRLTIELGHAQRFSEQAERMASRIGGSPLFALLLYVIVGAALGFVALSMDAEWT